MAPTKQFPLPKVSAAADLFKPLCVAVSTSALPELRTQLAKTMQEVTRHQNDVLGPSIVRANELSERCHYLLDRYDSYSKYEQALVVGVVRYFVRKADAIKDDKPVVGFDDDTMIMNHVLEELRISGRFIVV